MSKELVTKAEAIRDEVRVGANTAKRVGGILAEISREVNGLYDNVLDWINNEKPVGNGFILTQSDVVNNLEDESELKPLSAKQGMILKAILDTLVVDDTTTDDETKALSARQGKAIADNLKNHNHDTTYQKLGNYATATHNHPATDIEENSTHRFMTDNERNTLSSLGTKAILSEAQNFGQNGYQKLSNGLLFQWGTNTGTPNGSLKYLNLNISFYDTNYSIQFAGLSDSNNEKIVYAPMVVTKNVGNVTLLTRYIAEGGGINTTAWRFNWFAIGRWK